MSLLIESLKDKLEIVGKRGSTLICKCPVCGGTNLKLNLSPSSQKYGAYRCWDNYCSPTEIKRQLGLKLDSSENRSFIFSESDLFTTKFNLLPTKPESFSVEDSIFCSVYRDYQPPKEIKVRPVSRICYYYSNKQRLVRLNSQKKKILILQYWNYYSGWAPGVGFEIWPFYTTGCDLSSGDTICFVEGEKTAEVVKSSGLACLTSCSAFFNYPNLYINFLNLKRNTNIKNIVYTPDDDEAGLKKSEEISKACISAGLRLKIKDIKKLNFKKVKGFDLADIADHQIIYDFILNDY